jgi:hypothetical protein
MPGGTGVATGPDRTFVEVAAKVCFVEFIEP